MEDAIYEVLRELALRHHPQLGAIKPEHVIVDELGLESLDVAQLVAVLEDRLGVDPFATTAITSVRTVADLCAAYRRALAPS
ncbi:MAG TPA: acyl carrier protein [Kofleriaceae bacterium]